MTYEIGSWRSYAERYKAFAPELPFSLDPRRCALVIVDAQRKTFDPQAPRGMGKSLPARFPDLAGPYFKSLRDTVMPNLISLLTFFRQSESRIVYTTVGPRLVSGDDLPYSFKLQYQSALALGDGTGIHAGSPEYAIVDELQPEAGELVVNKVSRSAFSGTGLENLLHNMEIDQLVVCGGATHACVESTGRSASDLGFQVAIAEDACISQFPLLHDAAMINFHMSMGRVVNTRDAIGELVAGLA
jgi:nicotinamidase-related amidase